jgi:hypothetical protein
MNDLKIVVEALREVALKGQTTVQIANALYLLAYNIEQRVLKQDEELSDAIRDTSRAG